MKRCLQNDDSTINEGASSSKSRSTNIVNECITNNNNESKTQIDSTTDSNDDNIMASNNTSGIENKKIFINEKRKNYLSWDDLFMAIACFTAKFSKGVEIQVGACIVDLDKKIVGIGYEKILNFPKKGDVLFKAESNAILNKNSINVQNCTMYVSRYPCVESVKMIIQSGIKEVVYLPNPSYKSPATKKMIDASGIKIREQTPKQDIPLHFKETNAIDLNFDDLFMTIAYLIAQRSKDPVTQVGACIVDSEKKIVSTGYNGMPTGCNDDEFPWGKNNLSELENKFIYVCHAEMNAVFYKSSVNVKGCTIYVSLFPCEKCAIIIIQSDIKNVVYFSDPKNVVKGLPCTVYNKTYDNGETFRLDCRTQCTCQNGTYACASLCPQENISPQGLCRHPRLVEVPGQCCREWMCDNVNMERPPNCEALVTPWAECSSQCGLGLSRRVSNANEACKPNNETRLCQIRPCHSPPLVNAKYARHHHIRKGHECKATIKSTTPVRLKFGDCRSRKTFHPKRCGGACPSTNGGGGGGGGGDGGNSGGGGIVCAPDLSTTVKVEFLCRSPVEGHDRLDGAVPGDDLWEPVHRPFSATADDYVHSVYVDVEWIVKCTCRRHAD